MAFKVTCNFSCWKCSNPCKMVKFFQLPDPFFYKFVIDNAKAHAGLRLANGHPLSEVNLEMKKNCVALKIARDKYLENTSK